MLADSNIVIYSTQPSYPFLREFITLHNPVVSAISQVETLGFSRLDPNEKILLERFFATVTILPITQPIIEAAIQLRQQKKMTLGDAIVAATCLIHHETLVTRNTKDFDWITNLTVLDPFAAANQTPPAA